MIDVIQEVYGPLLCQNGFIPRPENARYGSMGQCWELEEGRGAGFYWTYGQKDLFDIKIHDFYLHDDTFFEFNLPKCLSVTYYESISGEELTPYRRLNAGCIKAFVGGRDPYRMLVHKKIPIRSVGIEFMPAYYEDYLKRQYPNEYIHPLKAFQKLDQTDDFPGMVRLLQQVKSYRGNGIAAKLFYESKVAEAASLVVEWARRLPQRPEPRLTDADRRQIETVTAYINDHCAFDLPLDRLSKIACMGTTKLKTSFRQVHGCTITGYIQQRRMSRAEYLLSSTDLPIGQVARTVGYRSASRFAELFHKSTGLLPLEFRKTAK
ncbi:AraC family transcriptional regulator [Ruminococcaceae bacterium BL-6]|nr:AraC family transcriptional regulator [Ruminococcaceae bacterium BL-6]